MKNLKLLIGLIVGAVVYRFLMWDEALGTNAFVFATLLVAAPCILQAAQEPDGAEKLKKRHLE
jgi:hypothetical protein